MSATRPTGLLPWVPAAAWRNFDAALGVLYAIPAGMVLLNEATGPPEVAVALVAAIGCSLTIVLRRSRPLLALAIQLVVALAVQVVEPRAVTATLLPIALILYTLASEARAVVAVTGLAATAAIAVATAFPEFRQFAAASTFLTLFVISWTLGYAVGLHRRDLRHQLQHERRRTEAEREHAELRLTRERIRIARELHDIVAHSMSVVTVQAGYGGLVFDDDPEKARSALTTIEMTGRTTLIELRELLTLLRREPVEGDEPPRVPTPCLDDLPALVSGMSTAGLYIRVSTSGAARPLPAGLGLAAYRILQEALTNVVRHAGTATATVSLDYRKQGLGIVVRDLGRGSGRRAFAAGHGVIGMHERADLYGGSLEAAPLPGGGFEVRCFLPLPEIAVPTADVRTRDAG